MTPGSPWARSVGLRLLLRPALVCLASCLGAAVLWAAGRRLPAPPLLHPVDWPAWWRAAGPVEAVYALARCAAVTVAVLWALSSAAMLATRLLLMSATTGNVAWTWLARWAGSRGRVRMVRVLVGFSASGGLLAGCGLHGGVATVPGSGSPVPGGADGGRSPGAAAHPERPAPGAAARPVPPAPVLLAPAAGPVAGLKLTVPVRAPAPQETPAPRPRAPRPPVPAPAPYEHPAPARQETPALRPGALAPAATATEPPPAPGDRPARRQSVAGRALRTWTVGPGDDFWSIAETVVHRSAAGAADRDAVASYWSRLVEANRARLPVPGDPDLLFPGDVLIVPVPGPAVAPD